MIHRNKGRKLKRTASHRKSLLSNLTVSLIKNKKLQTTLAKARELRVFIEPIINKSKKAHLIQSSKPEYGIHLRREVNRFLNDKGAIKMLFDEIGPKVSERNGGYTRVLKMGRRFGDGAEIAMIELVDYNVEQAATETGGTTASESKTKSKKTKVKTAKSKKETETVKKKSALRVKKKKEAAEE